MKVCILSHTDFDMQNFPGLVAALPFGEAEQKRLLAIKNPRAAAESLGGFLCLAKLLAPFSDKNLTILRSAGGKSHFRDPTLPDFNISHSGCLSAALLSEESENAVGLDLEQIRPFPGYCGIAERFFSDAEREELSAHSNDLDFFFLLWTRKEAYAKRTGNGLCTLLAESSAVCTGFFKSYRITKEDKTAILTLCAESAPRSIQIFCNEEIKYHELPY